MKREIVHARSVIKTLAVPAAVPEPFDASRVLAHVPEVESVATIVRNHLVVNDDQFKLAADMMNDGRALLKEIDSQRKLIKEPYAKESKRIDETFSKLSAPLSTALDDLRSRSAKYTTEIEKKRAEEQRKQDEAIKRAADRARERGDDETARRIESEGAELKVEKESVKSEKTTTNYREVFDSVKVTDFAAVPDKFKKIDESAVRQAFIWYGKKLSIPGLVILTRTSLTVRGKSPL